MIAWLQVTSGRGPDECAWVVARVMDRMIHEAMAQGHDIRILETVPAGPDGAYKSALLAIEGEDVSDFVASWQGTILWIGPSPFRPITNERTGSWVSTASRPPPNTFFARRT